MLELLAMALEDGWAYVRSDDEIRLVRPPYTRRSSWIVSREAVNDALSRQGFVRPPAERREFAGWRELIAFLEEQIVAARRIAGAAALEDGIGEQLLDFAPPEVLRRFVERVRVELIPGCKWEHAENVLLKMLSLRSFREAPGLSEEAVGLLQQVVAGRARQEQSRRALVPQNGDLTAFPQTMQRYGPLAVQQLADAIVDRGHVFALQ
jgi:hypothetical protein